MNVLMDPVQSISALIAGQSGNPGDAPQSPGGPHKPHSKHGGTHLIPTPSYSHTTFCLPHYPSSVCTLAASLYWHQQVPLKNRRLHLSITRLYCSRWALLTPCVRFHAQIHLIPFPQDLYCRYTQTLSSPRSQAPV